MHCAHHALSTLTAEQIGRIVAILSKLNVTARVISFVVVRVTIVLTTCQGFLTLAPPGLCGVFLIPAFLLLTWSLDDTNEKSLVNRVHVGCLFQLLLQEEEIFFRRLVIRVLKLLLAELFLSLLLSLALRGLLLAFALAFVIHWLQEERGFDLVLE